MLRTGVFSLLRSTARFTRGEVVAVDLAAVSFMDSSAINELLQQLRDGRRLTVCAASRQALTSSTRSGLAATLGVT